MSANVYESMAVNLKQALQSALKAITASVLNSGTETPLQLGLGIGSQVLLATQKIAEIREQIVLPTQQLQAIVSVIAETFEFPLAFIEQYDAHHEQLHTLAAHGFILTLPHSPITTSLHQNLSGAVVSTEQPMIWAEESDSITLPQLEGRELFTSSFHTVVVLPLIAHQQVMGVLTLIHPDYQHIEPYILHWLKGLGAHAASVLDNLQNEQSQLQIQQRLEFTALGLQGVFYDLNLEQHQIIRTEGLVNLLGYEEHEIDLSITWWISLMHPADQLDFRLFLEQKSQNFREFSLFYRVRRKNDQYISIRDRGIVLRNDQGKPIRFVGSLCETNTQPTLETGTEIIEQSLDTTSVDTASVVRIEQSPNPEILEIANSTHLLVNRIQDVIFKVDIDGCWTFLNPSWQILTGFSVEETLSKPWQDFIAPEDMAVHQSMYRSMQKDKVDCRDQMRYLAHQREPRWVEVHCQPLYGTEGNFEGIAGTIHDITERKTVESQLLHNAMHDPLTELPNRSLFMDRLHHAYQNYRRHQHNGFAVLFLDLDRFKVINDSLGHAIGDELLKSVATRLKQCLRPGDTVARLGGDEFTILLLNVTHSEAAIQVSDRILSQFHQPFYLDKREIFVSGSIGMALSLSPEQQPEELLRNADIALYRAKNNGKGRHELFIPTMHVHALEQMELESDLHRAIERHELMVYYQPIYTLPQCQLAGFEALLRWDHPKRGVLVPADFLNLAEETGLLVNIGWWVLETACRQLQQWQQQDRLPSQIFMSVNLAAQQIEGADFVTRVQQTLKRLQLSPSSLMLEIGETVFDSFTSRENLLTPETTGNLSIVTKLQQLKDIGIQLCLDEFGRHFSTLGDFNRLPLHILKIDRSFISEMQTGKNLELVRSILTLGHKLGLKVIAEGIENGPQIAQLQALKCHYGQGHFFALASPAHDLSHLLDAQFLSANPANIAMVSESPPILIIRTLKSLKQIPLVEGRSWSMGRSVDSTVVLTDRWVSRNHAEIQLIDHGSYYLVDLGSGNGSFVNGERVTMPVCLKDGDLLTIGRTEIEFQATDINDPSTRIQDTSPKTILIVQASQRQGEVWREALASQGLSVVCLSPEIDLQSVIEQQVQASEPLPDLLLLDMTTLRPNPYSFCRWCHSHYPQLKIVLTSGTRTEVPASERQWAIYQGALDLLAAFPEANLFANIVEVATKIRSVLDRLDAHPVSQQSLASALMSMQSVIHRDTIITDRLPSDGLR